jgi:hypothetical protein
MTMTTKTLLTLALCSITVLPLRVAADPPGGVPPGQLYRSLESGAPSRPAGKVHGTIESIDYSSGVVIVRSGNRITAVAIVPSTTIYGGGGYAGLSDLRRGQTVDMSIYEIGGRFVAQSVRVK